MANLIQILNSFYIYLVFSMHNPKLKILGFDRFYTYIIICIYSSSLQGTNLDTIFHIISYTICYKERLMSNFIGGKDNNIYSLSYPDLFCISIDGTL